MINTLELNNNPQALNNSMMNKLITDKKPTIHADVNTLDKRSTLGLNNNQHVFYNSMNKLTICFKHNELKWNLTHQKLL